MTHKNITNFVYRFLGLKAPDNLNSVAISDDLVSESGTHNAPTVRM